MIDEFQDTDPAAMQWLSLARHLRTVREWLVCRSVTLSEAIYAFHAASCFTALKRRVIGLLPIALLGTTLKRSSADMVEGGKPAV